jgi:hypothetical protein
MWRVAVGEDVREVPADKAMEVAGEMYAKHGVQPSVTAVPAPLALVPPAPKPTSDFNGNLVHDAEAKSRITAQYAVLEAAGIKGIRHDKTPAGYSPGTRMADVGYANQLRREVEHANKRDLRDAALANRVRNEKREDVVMSAAEFAENVGVDHKVTVGGFAISERAIRGLVYQLESCSLSYLLGLRARIVREVANAKAAKVAGDRAAFEAANQWVRSDRAQLAETIIKECRRAPDVGLKIRRRKALGDVFAVVSPTYAPADAPEVIGQVLDQLPEGAKGSFAYDPSTTAWELRAHVWTPTPVAEQAVGEAFEGYASFQYRDNGTSDILGSGGITILACLNSCT